MLGEESIVSKALYLYGKYGRKCGGHKCEGVCALPGKVWYIYNVVEIPIRREERERDWEALHRIFGVDE